MAYNESYALYEIKQVGYFDYFFGYSNNAFPIVTGGNGLIKQGYYYDDYLFKDNDLNSVYNDFYQTDTAFSDSATIYTKGKITGKIDKSNLTKEIYYYDKYGRIIRSIVSTTAGVLCEGNKYSFSGHLLKSNKRYNYSSNPDFNYSFSYFYDHDWRPTHTTMKVGGTTQQINAMQYNELSQLKEKYMHGNSGSYMQKQSFAYNIRGWLTGINSLGTSSTGAFAQKIYYNEVPSYMAGKATARYNGNIQAIEWRNQSITPTGFASGYVFSYDELNRLNKALFMKLNLGNGSVTWDQSATVSKYNYGLVTSVGTVRGINYDKNGNIKTLSRLARRSSDTDIVLFDSLSYTYVGNRLKRVSDAISGQNALKDFPGGGFQAAETFFYDANGNMINDNVRGIQLTYNPMNMPLTILSDEGRIENTYSWDGTKRRRRVLDGYEQQLSDERYFGDLVTENGVPSLILHADGYVDVSGMPMFNYHLTDHLGIVNK
ncbi:MAG: hypothetical protein CVT92_17355 [Bacteroidetes bacterium HGW-Bacteroidetes-1]|nr:MAG: hypothetical protein CVT92_17355 [Bacteroidetes bacterium HGW-Bacteroidetes-1]